MKEKIIVGGKIKVKKNFTYYFPPPSMSTISFAKGREYTVTEICDNFVYFKSAEGYIVHCVFELVEPSSKLYKFL
jgi:hypothetical protein